MYRVTCYFLFLVAPLAPFLGCPAHVDDAAACHSKVGAEEKPMPTPDLSDLAICRGENDALTSGTAKFNIYIYRFRYDII